MKSFLCRILALGTFLFWGAGLGQYWHETIVHGYENAPLPLIAGKALPRPLPSAPRPHSDDDCAVCQGLATMAAQHATPPVVPVTLEKSVVEPVIERSSPLVAWVCSFIPIRGPPVVATSL